MVFTYRRQLDAGIGRFIATSVIKRCLIGGVVAGNHQS